MTQWDRNSEWDEDRKSRFSDALCRAALVSLRGQLALEPVIRFL